MDAVGEKAESRRREHPGFSVFVTATIAPPAVPSHLGKHPATSGWDSSPQIFLCFLIPAVWQAEREQAGLAVPPQLPVPLAGQGEGG